MESFDFISYLRYAFALLFVLGLIGLGGFGLKVWSRKVGAIGPSGKRLKINESLNLDQRHRIILVQCDDKEHLVVLGPNGAEKLDTNHKDKDGT